MQTKRYSLRCLALAPALAAATGCAAKAPVRVAAIASLPAEIVVREWPYWVDIPIQSTNADRVWRTVIDVVGAPGDPHKTGTDRLGATHVRLARWGGLRQYLTEER